MKNKKFFAKALAFAMVMGTIGAHGAAARPTVMVEAAEVKAPGLTVDYETFEATLTPDTTTDSNAKYVCLQVLKDAAGSKVSASYWYKVNGGSAVVDLSFLKATKAQYIRAYTVAGGEGEVFTVNAQPKTSIKYDAKAQQFTNKAKAVLNNTELAKFEYHPLYGSDNWESLDGLDPSDTVKKAKLEQLALAGTTIVVRSKADTTSAADKQVPAGTEVKLKISAVAKAPKVKVDYAKSLITIPKGAEVMLDDGTSFTSVEGKLSPEDLLKKLSVTDTKTKMATGFNLVVRTAAQTGKKPASNVDVVAIKAAVVLEADASKGTTVDSANSKTVKITDKSTGANITLAEDSTKGKLKATYAKGTDTNKSVVDSEFIYSTDEGKTWKKVGNNVTGEVFFTAEEGSTTKLLISVTPEEGTFAPEPIEVTFKAGSTT